MPRRQTPRPSAPGTRQQVRIIGGRWRGRKLSFPDTKGLRPSSDRIRETLFNWLASRLTGAHCLDLFAGSGALGFEALSRGAACAVMLEKNRAVITQLRASAATLNAGDAARIVEADTLQWLTKSPAQAFDVVFLDPPFSGDCADDWYTSVPALLHDQGWLAEDAVLYVESAQPLSELDIGTPWRLLREKRAGLVYHGLYGLTAALAVNDRN